MAPQRGPQPPPDLANYRAGDQLSTFWNGPRVTAEFYLKRLIDFGDSVDIFGFLFSDPKIEDELRREPVRPLGKGNFGQVALWHELRRDCWMMVASSFLRRTRYRALHFGSVLLPNGLLSNYRNGANPNGGRGRYSFSVSVYGKKWSAIF